MTIEYWRSSVIYVVEDMDYFIYNDRQLFVTHSLHGVRRPPWPSWRKKATVFFSLLRIKGVSYLFFPTIMSILYVGNGPGLAMILTEFIIRPSKNSRWYCIDEWGSNWAVHLCIDEWWRGLFVKQPRITVLVKHRNGTYGGEIVPPNLSVTRIDMPPIILKKQGGKSARVQQSLAR
jgi:hypothetical protein